MSNIKHNTTEYSFKEEYKKEQIYKITSKVNARS